MASSAGFSSADGPLARHWAAWLAAAFGGFILWALPTSLTLDGREAPLIVHAAGALGFTIACAAGCFSFLAICLRFATRRHWALDSLSANAYSMYLNHYVFMVWLQFAVLDLALFAVGKAAIVFMWHLCDELGAGRGDRRPFSRRFLRSSETRARELRPKPAGRG